MYHREQEQSTHCLRVLQDVIQLTPLSAGVKRYSIDYTKSDFKLIYDTQNPISLQNVPNGNTTQEKRL